MSLSQSERDLLLAREIAGDEDQTLPNEVGMFDSGAGGSGLNRVAARATTTPNLSAARAAELLPKTGSTRVGGQDITRLPFTPDLEEIVKATSRSNRINDGWRLRTFVFSRHEKITDLALWVKVTPCAPHVVVDHTQYNPLRLELRGGQWWCIQNMEVEGSQYQLNAIKAVQGTRIVEKVVSIVRPMSDVRLAGSRTLYFLYKRYIPYYRETKTLSLIDGSASLLAYILPMCWIPNLMEDMNRYNDNPDDRQINFREAMQDDNTPPEAAIFPTNPDEWTAEARNYLHLVEVDREIRVAYGLSIDKEDYPINAVLSPWTTDDPVNSSDDIAALAFLHLFMLVKKGEEAWVRQAVETRIKALKMAAGLESLNVEKFMVRFYKKSLSVAAERFVFYPRLKAVIFSSVLSGEGAFSNYSREILKDSQLTIFNMIVLFCGSTSLTLLHVIDPVLNEYATFKDAKDKLVRLYGDPGWRYCKLINPDENLSTLSRFPHLSKAAKAYIITTTLAFSLRNLKGMRDVPNAYYGYASKSLDISMLNINEHDIKTKLSLIAPPNVVESLDFELLRSMKTESDTEGIPPAVREFLSKAYPGKGE